MMGGSRVGLRIGLYVRCAAFSIDDGENAQTNTQAYSTPNSFHPIPSHPPPRGGYISWAWLVWKPRPRPYESLAPSPRHQPRQLACPRTTILATETDFLRRGERGVYMDWYMQVVSQGVFLVYPTRDDVIARMELFCFPGTEKCDKKASTMRNCALGRV